MGKLAAAETEVETLLAAARREFGGRLVQRTREIADLADRGAWAEARRAVHKLRGSAATYGFAQLGACMKALEEALPSGADPLDAAARPRVAELIERARSEAERACRSPS